MKEKRFPRTARGVALETLCRVETDASYAAQTLDHLLDGLSSEDRTLATRLVYGTLQKRIFLDFQLEHASGRPLIKMDVPVRNDLRLGAYQRFFCDKIPASAAVNESVNLVKACGFTSAAGLTNAVLRKLDPSETVLPDGEIEALAVSRSLPAWMVYHLRKSYRDEPLAELTASLDEVPPVYLRVNTLRITPRELSDRLAEEGVRALLCGVDGALVTDKLPSLKHTPSFAEGLFHVQDLASQLCALALDPQEGDRVLDLCAAPGGKSFTLAELADHECELLSCDLHPARADLIRSGAERLGLTCITAAVSDATEYHAEFGTFDRVLCDVPCSGLGVIRRKPEIRFKPEEELKKYPPLQKTILSNACRYVKQGGRLVYSTCTLDPAENEGVVTSFLSEHPDFSPVPLFEGDARTARTFFPHKDGTDGFFAAAFVKTERRTP